MDVTRVKFYPFDSGDLLARCSIVLDDSLQVHRLEVRKGSSGLFVKMPALLKQTGEPHRDLVHAVHKDFGGYLNKVVLLCFSEYERTGESLFYPTVKFTA